MKYLSIRMDGWIWQVGSLVNFFGARDTLITNSDSQDAQVTAVASLDWLQTLADGTRVRLLHLLEHEELSVSELCTILQLPQSTVSRHLKVLAADGWLANRRDGTNHLYRVDTQQWNEPRCELWRWVRGQASSPATLLDEQRLKRVLADRSRSEAFFSSTAERWDKLRVDLFGQQLDAFTLAATLPGNATVGELGCGSAPLCHLIAPFVHEAIAVDNSAAMLSAARQRLSGLNNVRIEQSPLTEMSLEDQCLDAAWLVLVLPYLDSPADVLREAGRVLKSNAPLVIVDLLPHHREAYRQEMGHVRLGVAREQLEQWLSAADMRLDRYHALPPDPSAKGPALFAAVALGLKTGG